MNTSHLRVPDPIIIQLLVPKDLFFPVLNAVTSERRTAAILLIIVMIECSLSSDFTDSETIMDLSARLLCALNISNGPWSSYTGYPL
jgi:general stress protein CsbA